MSYSSWSLGRDGTYVGGNTRGLGGGERQRDEAIFTSLLPVNGKVSGPQVKNVFQASGLTQQQLAQIWTMADQDGDGYINMSEFCSAMTAIRQAKLQQQRTSSLQRPTPRGGGGGGRGFSGVESTQSLSVDTSQQISKSRTFPSFKEQPSVPSTVQSPQVGGVGRGVSLSAVSEGWSMNAAEKRNYMMQFNMHDNMKRGFLSGAEVKPVLNRSGLEQSILARIWALSDVDSDGRLSREEFAIAMHLIEKAKKGLTIPHTLPAGLAPSQVAQVQTDQLSSSSTSVSTSGALEQPKTFEDKRKENFDAGKQELERRRRAIQEKLEKEEAEKERKRKQEEEQRRQQELEAERRRQAELERQNRIALEIQKERERQLVKLAEQREAEQREMERKRKEEWARKRQQELEGVKEWEMKALRALQSQHSNLENELQQLDQQKMASRDSVVRQSSLCEDLRSALRSMRLSDEVKRAEITKLTTELHGLQSKLSSLATQRMQLQASLQSRSPQSLQYQKERQVYQDGIMGVAAVLAGLRSTLKSGMESCQKQKELLSNNTMMLSDMQTELQKDTAKSSTLRSQVAHHRSLWEEREKRASENERRRWEAERRAREEREREAKEARLEKIRREQEQAIRERKEARIQETKAKEVAELDKLFKKGTASPSPPPQTSPTRHVTPPTTRSNQAPQVPPKPMPYQPPTANMEVIAKLSAILRDSGASKKEEKEKEKIVKKKVSELKQRKAELEKQKRPLPAKPTPYGGKKQKKTSPPISSVPLSSFPPLLDIESSWDSSAQNTSYVPNPKSSFNPLQPQRAGSEVFDSNVLVSDGRAAKSPELQTGQSIEQPTLQLGQASLSTGQPTVADKCKATVTESHAEAQPPAEVEELYSVVKKPRANTRTSLDYGKRRRTSAPSASLSPPPKDWVLISTQETKEFDQKDNEQIMTAPTISTTTDKKMSSTSDQSFSPPTLHPITSTPIRATTSPSLLSGDSSTGQPLSSSWVDIQSTTEQGGEENIEPPQLRGTAASSSVRTVKYRALYSFDAEGDAEISFREGDILNGIPGELPSNGWLMVEVKGQQGLVPESYLEEVKSGEGVIGGSEDVIGGSRGSVERDLEAATQDQEQFTPREKAKVLYNWKGSKDNHLSIKKGEVISILNKSEKWWSGESKGSVGWFPKTFVKILEEDGSHERVEKKQSSPTARTTAEDLYQALYDYEGLEDGDLMLKTGDIIQVTSKEGDWWKGTLNGRFGAFPCNYVQPHAPSSETVHSTSPPVPPSPSISVSSMASNVAVISHPKPLVAKAIQEFEAKKENELNLKSGQYMKVFKQAGNGWWFGELQSRGKQRQRGWFPADKVELLHKKEGDSGPPSAVTSSVAVSSGQTTQPTVPNVLGAQRARSPLIDILNPQESRSLSQNLVLALYTYNAASSDELTFHKGSVITVLAKKGEWWKGELNGIVGLFPSNYVQPLNEQITAVEATRWAESVNPDVLASVSKTERKRQEAIFELLSSERNYTDSLKFVREVYFEPMVDSGVLTDEEMAKVRVNWDELIECNSNMLNAFLVRLRTSGSIVKNLGDILHTQIPLLMPHVRWCSCQLTACTLLQSKASDPQFKEFEQKCAEDPRVGGLPLSSFLLKPMQRITKYPLLIQRIIDYTAEDHMDYSELKGALDEAQRLCHSVNEAVRLKENTEQLEWLQSNIHFSLDERLVFNSQTNFMGQRKLLHWGKLFKIRGSRDLVGFLFNDFFLLVKPKQFFSRAATPSELEPFGKNEFIMYRTPYLLGDITVSKASTEQYGPSVFLMNYPSEEKDIPLKADSDPARDVWIKMIQDARLEYLKTKRRREQEMKKKWAQTMKHTVGVLKVTVVKAEDLKASDPNGKSDPFCVLSFSQQEENTPVVTCNLNPKWNYDVTFAVHDLNQDVLEISVFDKDLFSPNDFLGCCRVALKDLLQEGDSPWRKQVLLEDVQCGELELILELTLNKSDLLL